MKKIYPIFFLILSIFAIQNSFGQGTTAKVDWTYVSNCLKVEAKPTYFDSSCTSVTWVIGSSSTTSYSGNYLSHTFTTPGKYQICMKYTNKCTKWDTTICKTIAVDTCPCSFTPYFTFTKDSSNCFLYKYMAFPANSNTSASGKYTYLFVWGNGTTSSSRDGSFTFSKSGTYKICLKVKYALSNGNYCIKEVCKTITVNCAKKCTWNTPKISYTNRCNSYKFTATDQNDSCVYYKWSIDSGLANYTTYGTVAEYKFKTKGYHKIKLTYYNSCTGCDTTLVKYIYDTCMTYCNWSGAGMNASKTNCYTYNFEANYIKDTCISYTFIVGNKVISYNRVNSYYFTSNGTYAIGYRYYNKCTDCDTIIWKKLEINCFKNTCNWPSNLGYNIQNLCPYIKITANDLYDSCTIYKCYINDSLVPYYGGSNRTFAYKFSRNGTYKICLKLYNPCNGCDTILCKTYTVDCIKSSKCNWPNISWNYSSKCRNYTFETTNLNDSCISYYYKVGSNNGSITTLAGRLATYEFSSNGTYQVCLWMKNTCTNCDTMLCKTIVVNCNSTKSCNWNNPSFTYAKSSVDSCLYTFEAKNMNNVCVTYKWYLGDSSNTNILNGRLVQHKFGQSGVQHVYLILSDTCNDCDTFIHKEMYMNCWGVNTKFLSINKTQIFPNPVQNSFNIESRSNASIIIYDGLGRILGNYQNKETLFSVDCSNWSSGIYFIQVNDGVSIEKLKIIKP